MEVLFALIFLVLGLIAVNRKRWVRICFASMLLCFIPAILRRYSIVVDAGLELYLFIALLLHLIGGVFRLYERYNWDFLTHIISGIGAAAAFLAIISTFDKYTETINLTPWAMALVVVLFTEASGVLWEIGEFASDALFGTHEQQGLHDIISDLANDLAGAIITALFAILYIKSPDGFVSLDYNAIRKFYPQLGFMHALTFIGALIFFIYFLIKKEPIPLFFSSLLIAFSAASRYMRIPVLVMGALFAVLLIEFIAELFSFDIGIYHIAFAISGLIVAHTIFVHYITNPWFFIALIPVSALSLSALYEILRYFSKKPLRYFSKRPDREVMMNFVWCFIASLLAAFSDFIYIIT